MANPNDKSDQKKDIKMPSGIAKLAGIVVDNIDKLYQNTYFSKPVNSKNLSVIKNRIDKSIDDIITNNLNNVGVPNISKLYNRMGEMQKDKSVIKDVSVMFDDKAMMDNILTSYMQNSYLKDLDNEIDLVCKYMPKLLEALDTRKDNVLSSDHFSKDFINVSNDSSILKDTSFNERINTLKDKYDLAELFETSYNNASRYGEQFIYIVPYNKALSKLLSTKSGTRLASAVQNEQTVIYETKNMNAFENSKGNIEYDSNKYNIRVELNMSNMLISVVEAAVDAREKITSISESALNYFTEATSDEPKLKMGSKIVDDLSYEDFEKSDTADGLISSTDKIDKKTTVKLPGCIVKKIDRANIVPIYIDDLCLGYYYLEFKETDQFESAMKVSDSVTGSPTGGSKLYSQASSNDINQDKMLKYISGQLSSFIDAKFINKNQDLRKEIYMILKHNDLFNTASSDKIKVTFLPPEDVVHMYFKKDPNTNRGISDLARSLLAAKLYSSLYVTNSLAIMTRGQDKRVYYVKQNIDTNIAKVLLNTIDQIKKSNFGIRQIENMNHLLNLTGKFNDYIIPVGPNGDSPVQFEVMPGQNVEIKTELMNVLEEMAINSTDVPLELIQARQSIDYALQLTMTNSKFLRKIYNRQAKTQKYFSDIVTKLYNGEFEVDEALTVMLPPPMFLNVTNTNQIMDNTNALVASIVEMEMADEADVAYKATFTKNLKRYYLSSYLDMNAIEAIKIASKHEVVQKGNPPAEGQ